MRILITGGAGFIGSHTADALIERGHEVRLFDNLQKPVHLKGKPKYLHPGAEFVFGDVRDRDALAYALDGVDVVYHFAAYQDYLPDFSTFFDVNARATALLYELIVARALPVRRVIVASSQAVLGEGLYECQEHGLVVPNLRPEADLRLARWNHTCRQCGRILAPRSTSEDRINPQNQYALSKQAAESIAIHLGRRYNIPSVAMRYSIVQGPRQSFYNAYSGAMRIFALHLYFNRSPTIYEDGMQLRDFVNIADVVSANVLVLTDPRADYEVFNVGGGRAYTIAEFYEAMVAETGREVRANLGSLYRFGDTRHIVSDISRLQRLGWQPNFSIRDSIRTYWDYLQHQHDIEDILAHATRTMRDLDVVRSIKADL